MINVAATPARGDYLSRDPLGLAGGLRVYGYVEDPTSWIDPLGLSAECRGRLQAQGGGTEKSVSWAQDAPPTTDEGLRMLDELEWSLTKAERKARKVPLVKAREWIEAVGQAGGVSGLVSKTFLAPGSKDVRIDVEVIKGTAFE